MKDVSIKITKTITGTSIKDSKALESLNEKVLELMKDRGMIAPYLASSLVNLLKAETESHFRLIKDINSTKVYNFLINTIVPVTLISNMLTFKDSNNSFRLDGHVVKTIIKNEFNFYHSSQQDRKLIYELGKEKKFDNKPKRRPSIRDESVTKLPISPAIMASGIPNTIFLPTDSNELCDRLKLLLKHKQVGSISELINEEIVAIVDYLLEYKCISKKQHKQLLFNCNLIHD